MSLFIGMTMMAPRLISTAAVLVLTATVASSRGQDPAPSAPPKFKSSVDIVSVTATVKDKRGRFVRDLQQGDFTVLEAGDPRRVVSFQAVTDGPVKVGLLVDASGSMRVGRKAVDVLDTVRHLFSAMRGNDEAALMSFDTQLDLVSRFTSDFAGLDSALQRLNPPFGQTSLYDAIGQATGFVADQARSGGQLPQRSALVVLTDGIDTKSRQTTQQVAAVASRIDVPVYIIAVMAPIDDPEVDQTPSFDAPDLQQLARATGGEMFTATSPAAASLAARDIVADLRHQYVFGFEASTTKPGWRGIEVRVRDSKLNVRARTGYTAGSSDRPAAVTGTPSSSIRRW
jgi:VWFA-related protein